MIKGYPEGSDLTIINCSYTRSRKLENGKWDKGYMTIVAKDNITGKKVMEEIEDPDYEFYFAKDDVVIENNEFFISKDKVDMYKVPYRDLEKHIAELTGNLNFYYDNIRNGQRYANNILHTHPRVFWSDTHIEDHYRFRFNRMYTNEPINVTKGYFDIEADTINMAGDFPEPGECPINAITLIDEKNNKVYTLLLRNKINSMVKEFEEEAKNKALYDELKSFIFNHVGEEKFYDYGLNKLDFQFLFYDEADEIKLIQDLFILINTIQPDFVLAWNMAFDIPYIIQRIINLGFDPRVIMCHPDFKVKNVRYYVDEKNQNEYAERGDKAEISSYSVYLDQMIQFASRRKGQSKVKSYKLDYIGELIAGVNKLDYSHITRNISEFPYKNYKMFVFYNIIDTIVQKCVEQKVGDIDYVFTKCIANNTRYDKCHRQTVYLANRGAQEFYNDGLIIGNNMNKNNPKPEEKFEGAFVGDPKLISDYSKKTINGFPVNIFDNLDDFDYARLYPSILQEFNMAPNTQIGKIIIEDKIHDKEDRFPRMYGYKRSSEFIEDFHSHVWLEFCTRWLHMADYSSLYDDVIEYFTSIANSAQPVIDMTDFGMIAIQRINPDLPFPRAITRSEEMYKAIRRHRPVPKKGND